MTEKGSNVWMNLLLVHMENFFIPLCWGFIFYEK